MKTSCHVRCQNFPCFDVKHESYLVPDIDLNPANISIVMVSESTPKDPGDYYYAPPPSLFQQTTRLAFLDAGIEISSTQDLLDWGIYMTTAVKCGKTGYNLKASTIRECSYLLEKELALFPHARVYMLMGDVAIKSLNMIADRAGEKQVIPTGSTYKLRNGEYYFRGIRVFPSYLQVGRSFFIEKSKRQMIAEDITLALQAAA